MTSGGVEITSLGGPLFWMVLNKRTYYIEFEYNDETFPTKITIVSQLS